jgi:transposase
MRHVQLSKSERITLEAGYKNHIKSHVRQRCQALLLSDEGWQVKQVAKLHHTRTRTIYTWMNRWTDLGIVGMMILPGRGLKPKLSVQDQAVVQLVKKKPARVPAALEN